MNLGQQLNLKKHESAKLTHGAVHYVARSKKYEHCAKCEHFIKPSEGGPSCTGVRSPISPKGWCVRFVEATAYADGGAVAKADGGGLSDADLGITAPVAAAPSAGLSDADLGVAAPSVGTDAAKSAGIGVAKGVIGFAGMPGDARETLSHATDYVANKLGVSPETTQNIKDYAYTAAKHVPGVLSAMAEGPTSSDLQHSIESQTGKFYEPKTTAGHYAQTVGEFVPAALAGPGGIGKKLVTQAVVPGLTSEAAGQAMHSTAAEPYARIAGGILGGAGANMASNALVSRAAKVATPTVDELKATSRSQFTHPEVAAVQIKAAPVNNLADTIRVDLEKQGFRDYANPVPFKAIDELANPRTASATAANVPVTVQDIGSIRGVLHNAGLERDAFGKLTPDAVAANIAVEHIDNFLVGLKQPDLIAGNAQKAAALLKEARANWGAAKRAENIQTLQRNAEIQAGSTYSGGNQNNATRQALRPLLRNDASKAYGYNDAELAQLEKAVTGTPVGNTARWVGKKLGNLASTAGVVGSIASGNPLPLAVIPAGMTARAIGNASASRQGRALDEMLRSRSPLMAARQAATPAAQTQPIYNKALLNALLASTAAREQIAMPQPQTSQ